MKTSIKSFRAVAALSLFVIAAFAWPQMSQETAKDPTCKMAVKNGGTEFSAEYEGKTYYFCSAACKEAFLKDPAKFVGGAESAQPGDAKDDQYVRPCFRHHREAMKEMMEDCPMMRRHVAMMHRMDGACGRMGRRMACRCPMCCGPAENMNVSVENTADGVVVKIASKDAETVKMIQERCARMKEVWTPCSKSKPEDLKKETTEQN